MQTALILSIALVLSAALLRHVYRGGTTLNDHAVAVVVTGCLWVYPTLALGLLHTTPPSLLRGALLILLGLGAGGIYGLFFLLDRRRPARGLLRLLGILSQPAYAFALWTGLLLLLWAPLALLRGHAEQALWPGGWLLIPAVLAGWGTAWTWLRHQQVRRHRLPGPPLRLVQLSDLHASPVMTGDDLHDLAARVNALEPDAVFVTGDLVMPFSEDEHADLIAALGAIHAPVLCCPGNHDLPILDRLRTELAEVGVRMLVDEQVTLALGGGRWRLEVVGLDFRWTGAREAALAALDRLPAAPDADYRVLLAHDPRYFRWLPAQRAELVLSGHTHGGQVAANMFGVPVSVLRPLGVFDQGFFVREGCRLYVHRGSWHTGLPPRMGVASEIAVFELGAADPATDTARAGV